MLNVERKMKRNIKKKSTKKIKVECYEIHWDELKSSSIDSKEGERGVVRQGIAGKARCSRNLVEEFV